MVSPNKVLEKCRRAGIRFWTGSKAALELKEDLNESMTDKEMNKKIYNTLKKHNKEAAIRFRNYHSIEVRTSDGKLQPFNKEKITQSLLRETKVPITVAKEIAEEVSEDVRKLQLQSISSSLVREMVNAKLLEKRQIDEKRNYSRIGLPIHDTKNIIEGNNLSSPSQLQKKFSSRVLTEYTLTKVLPKELSQEHLKGNLYIHDIEGFITSPISIQNNLKFFFEHGLEIPNTVTTGPAKNPEVAGSHAARVLLTSKKYASGGTGLDAFNTYISPYLEGLDKNELKQVAQTFLYELNQISTQSNSFTINLDEGVPDRLKDEKAVVKGEKTDIPYKEYEEEALEFTKTLLKTYKEGDYTGKTFKWPEICLNYSKKEINLEKCPRPIYLIKRKPEQSMVYEELLNEDKKGIMQTISLNLLNYLNKDKEKFKEKLKEEIEVAKKIMKEKKKNIEKKQNKILPFLKRKEGKQRYVKTEDLAYNISLTGLIKAAQILENEEKPNKKVKKQAKKMLKEIKKQKKDTEIDICLSQKPSKKTLNRFKESGIRENAFYLTKEQGETTKDIQKHLKGGAFLETKDESLINQSYTTIKLL